MARLRRLKLEWNYGVGVFCPRYVNRRRGFDLDHSFDRNAIDNWQFHWLSLQGDPNDWTTLWLLLRLPLRLGRFGRWRCLIRATRWCRRSQNGRWIQPHAKGRNVG